MNLELEVLEPEYTKEGFRPTQKIRRLDTNDGRYYLMENQFGVLQPYMSVTTAIGNALPLSSFLLEWQRNQGGHEAYKYELKSRADYGTFMHVSIQKYVEAVYELATAADYLEGDFINVERLVSDQIKNAQLVPYQNIVNQSEWQRKGMQHLYSFAAFFQEKEVEVLATEIPVASDNLLNGFTDKTVAPLAGCIDLVCWLNFKGKRVLAIVDFKSGKDFYESHVRQLAVYRELWNAAYPDYQIEMIFNWRPNDWRDSPTYTLQNQTKEKEADLTALKYILTGYFMENPVRLPSRKIYKPIKRGEPVSNFVTTIKEGESDGLNASFE